MRLYRDTIFIEPPYEQLLKDAGLDTVQAILDVVGDDVAAWSRTTDTIRVILGGNKNWWGGAFVKRYHYPRWKSRLKAMFRGTFFSKNRARTEYDTLRRMRQLNIPAVRPIAYGERRFFHFVTNCFLITEAVPQSTSLVSLCRCLEGKRQRPDVVPRPKAGPGAIPCRSGPSYARSRLCPWPIVLAECHSSALSRRGVRVSFPRCRTGQAHLA